METEQAKKRERSTAYPSYTLEESISFASQLRTALGKGPYGRVEAAKGLGYSGVSGVSATKISAMVHFGLLNRNGNTYMQSELSERINHPISDEDRNKAINEAITMPKLYRDLIADFSGQSLPSQLGNILIRRGISAKISEMVAGNFQKSLEFSGLLKNGVLMSTPNLSDNKPDDPKKFDENSFDPFFNNTSNNRMVKQAYVFNDSGEDWSLSVKSGRPLTSDIKKKLVDITEFLQNGEDKVE